MSDNIWKNCEIREIEEDIRREELQISQIKNDIELIEQMKRYCLSGGVDISQQVEFKINKLKFKRERTIAKIGALNEDIKIGI